MTGLRHVRPRWLALYRGYPMPLTRRLPSPILSGMNGLFQIFGICREIIR
jgi:hypothetical protein